MDSSRFSLIADLQLLTRNTLIQWFSLSPHMFLHLNSQNPSPPAVLARTSGSCCQRTSGGPRFGTTLYFILNYRCCIHQGTRIHQPFLVLSRCIEYHSHHFHQYNQLPCQPHMLRILGKADVNHAQGLSTMPKYFNVQLDSEHGSGKFYQIKFQFISSQLYQMAGLTTTKNGYLSY